MKRRIKRLSANSISRFVALALFAMLLPLASVFADEEQKGIPYAHIVTDASGESHFEDGELPFNMVKRPTGGGIGMYAVKTGDQASFMMIQPGEFEDWHPTPNSQILVVIQGEVEVGVSSGETRRFTPGMVVMMDDNAGKGHTTRTIGEIPHIALMIRKPAN